MCARPNVGRVGRRRVLAALASVTGANRLADAAAGRASTATRRPDGTGEAVVDRRAPRLDRVGRLELEGVTEAVVDDDDETVYCAAGDGFAVVDASNPFDPTVVSVERDLERDADDGKRPMTAVRDVKVSGDRLLVAGPTARPRFVSQSLKGFFLYDVSDPTAPERVAFHETSFGPHNSFVDGDHVYLTGTHEFGEPVVVYDVRDDDPEEVARWSPGDADVAWSTVPSIFRHCHDVHVQDGTMYAAYWDAGTWVVDVSDPTAPAAIAHLGGHDPAYLESIDRLSAEFQELPGNSHSVIPTADGRTAFVGKEAQDVPRTRRDGGPGGIECWDLDALDVDGVEPPLRWVLSPPEPRGEGFGWTAHNFGVDGDRLYTSWHGGGVRVYDVGDLANPLLLGEWRDPERTWFWTAKPIDVGFVATSYLHPQYSLEAQRQGEGASLFVFLDPSGEDAVPAPTTARRPFPDADD